MSAWPPPAPFRPRRSFLNSWMSLGPQAKEGRKGRSQQKNTGIEGGGPTIGDAAWADEDNSVISLAAPGPSAALLLPLPGTLPTSMIPQTPPSPPHCVSQLPPDPEFQATCST